MGDDPGVARKSKAVRTDGDVHQVAEVEVCHNDEPEVMADDWEDSLQFPASEDVYISNQPEGEGPPQVIFSSENLMSRQLLTNWRSCTTWKLSSRWY